MAEYYTWEGDSAESTNQSYNAPNFLLKLLLPHISGFKISSVTIPFSYYVITTATQQLQLRDNFAAAPGVGVAHTVFIPVGNYTSATMATALAAALTSASGYATYTVIFSSTTGKFTVSSSVPEPFKLVSGNPNTFDVQQYASPIAALGLISGTNQASAGGILVFPNASKLSGPDYLLLRSNVGLLNAKSLSLNDAEDSGMVLAKIPVNANPGGIIYWNDPDPLRYYYTSDTSLDRIAFSLSAGNSPLQLDLNGQSFQVKLVFSIDSTKS